MSRKDLEMISFINRIFTCGSGNNKVDLGIKILGLLCLIIIFFICIISRYTDWGYPNINHRQLQAKTNLYSIATAEISYFAENIQWSGSFEKVGWSPTGNPRYAYFLGPDEYIGKPLEELGLTLPVDFKSLNSLEPGACKAGFIAVAIGNIDADAGLDVWWIDQRKIPYNSQNDIDN